MNRWLKNAALQQQSAGYSSSFVWTHDSPHVLAYYAIIGQSVTSDSLPNAVTGTNLADVPAALIGKLAVDLSLQDDGNGGHLLVDAERRIWKSAQEGPGLRVVLVDAIDDAAEGFYEHFGYKPTGTIERRFYRKLSAIARDLNL